MNPEQPQNPREELEIKITALLLGELDAAEADDVRQALADDPELTQLHDQLKQTLDLVAAASSDLSDSSDSSEPLRLSEGKRDDLLAHFKVIQPATFQKPKRPSSGIRLVGIAALLTILAILAALTFPATKEFARKRPSSVTRLSGQLDDQEEATLASYAAGTPATPSQPGEPQPAPLVLLAADQKRRIQPESRTERTKLDIALPTQSSSEELLYAYGKRDGDYAKWGLTADGRAKQISQPAGGAAWYDRLGNTVGDEKNFGFAEGALGIVANTDSSATAVNEALAAEATVHSDYGSVAATRPALVADLERKLKREQTDELNSSEQYFFDATDAIALPALEQPQPTTHLWAMSGAAKGTELDSSGSRDDYSQVRDLAEKETATEGSTVVLGDLPTVGRLFRSEPQSGSDEASSTKALADMQSGLEQKKYLGGTEVQMVSAGGYVGVSSQPTTPSSISVASSRSSGVSGGGGGANETQAGQKPKEMDATMLGYRAQEVRKLPGPETTQDGRTTPLLSRSIPLDYAGPANVELALQSMLTDERSKVVADTGKRLVQITGAEAQIHAAEELVRELDTPSRQVIIEARIHSGGYAVGQDVNGAALRTELEEQRQSDRHYRIALPDGEETGMLTVESDMDHGADGIVKGLSEETSLVRYSKLREHQASTPALEETLSHYAELSGRKVLAPPSLSRGHTRDRTDTASPRESTLNQLDYALALDGIAMINIGDDFVKAVPMAQAAQEGAPVPTAEAPTPQPEVQTTANPFSTFSLNVSDVSFKLAAASLEQGQMPDVATVRSEEFINAFNYRDPAPAPGQPLAFAWERTRYPFAHNRDLMRFSVQTAARGREPGRPLNLVLLLDNSGSMERSDRVSIIRECLNVLASQLTPQDKISVVTFARTARLWVDGVPGVQAAASLATAGQLTPEGGTNLEEAMQLAYTTAERHYLANGVNRVVLLTDGAANLGNVEPETLKAQVESQRQQGIALDCFGIGWEGYNDNLLEVLSRNGDGRYGFVNTPQAAASEFANQLAGALQVAASDVKVQVQFNPERVTAYRQIGYARHQLTKEQFRDNTVDAAEIGAAEAGNALYVIETNPQGVGPVATVRARFKVPSTGEYAEHEWHVPYSGEALALQDASAAMKLAASASAFSEWLANSPYAGDVSPDQLLNILHGVPEVFGAAPRPTQLERMIREASRLAGN